MLVPGGEDDLINYRAINQLRTLYREELYIDFGGYLLIIIKEVRFINRYSRLRILKVDPISPLYKRCALNS